LATWAYACQSCGDEPVVWYADTTIIDEMAPDVQLVRVKVGSDWRCARVDRSKPVEIERLLIRQVVAADERECPECLQATSSPELVRSDSGDSDEVTKSAATSDKDHDAVHVQAAAISLQNVDFVVVVVSLLLVQSPGEADMVISDMAARFGGVPVVLLAQDEQGNPVFHGDSQLVELLAGIPLNEFPWKEYALK
jgi:hypothetical protein